ncbi:MAG: ribosomal protein L7/L12 [Chitinophagales bacterium]|nr:ribosomal protein L7/L12 [Chitinophagales bacterium]
MTTKTISAEVLALLSHDILVKVVSELFETVAVLKANLESEREYSCALSNRNNVLYDEARSLRIEIERLRNTGAFKTVPVQVVSDLGAELAKVCPGLAIKSQEDYIKARENERFCALLGTIEFEEHVKRKFAYFEDIQSSGKIGAIKAWRKLTGGGLREAKDIIEGWKF